MVFKQKDSEEPQVRALELRIKQSSDAKQRARLEKTLAMLRAGVKGEKQSAYHIDFVLKDSPNWAVIHDLRLELNGRVAQIDHILINRFLEIYVIESKSFRTKIRYANGGWERLNSSNFWEGIESPVEQNENHIFVLKDLIDTHQLAPTRFGLSPHFINIVSVQGSCSIIGKLPAKTKVERVDTLVRKLQKQEPSILWVLKIISPEILHAFAKTLLTYHQPLDPPKDFVAVRELPPLVSASSPLPQVSPNASRLCQSCTGTLSSAEIRYCKVHESSFGGKFLCRSCQPRPQKPALQVTIPLRAPQGATRSQNPASNPIKAPKAGAAETKTWEERMNQIKIAHPRAYKEWTPAEEARLTELFKRRNPIRSIADALDRQPGGIRARLIKLNLLEPTKG
jgi:hypothetical protein